jgi:hypothetical protein
MSIPTHCTILAYYSHMRQSHTNKGKDTACARVTCEMSYHATMTAKVEGQPWVPVGSTVGPRFLAGIRGSPQKMCVCVVLVLVLHSCAVTVSSTGAKNQLQGDDNGHVGLMAYGFILRSKVSSTGPGKLFKWMTTATSGVLARFPWLLPVRNSFTSYGASAVTRTSDRGHVTEAKNQCHRSERVLNQGFERNPSHP